VAEVSRYHRQSLFWGLGRVGQERLQASRALIVGLGALGAASADILARAGVALRIVDRDVLELSNLQRQLLYSTDDLALGLPKAELARRRLVAVNPEVEVEAHVLDLRAESIEALLDGVDVIVDGTDNFETRLLLNDASLKRGVPWVYCGVIGASVHTFPILPGDGPCFRCYLGEAPPPGSIETCDTAGVLGPAVLVAVGLACTEVIKILSGARDKLCRGLRVCDLWSGEMRSLGLREDPGCPACRGRFEALELKGSESSEIRLCGRGAVQLPPRGAVVLSELAERLRRLGEVTENRFLLRFSPREAAELELTVFRDGRVIVKGTEDFARARSLAARYVGS
jgi:molybdopterin/thiamine biosynthesis adenylyltransferase